MIKLVIKKEVRDEVIKALKDAFPRSNCAKGIEKYTKELAGLLLDELSRGVSNYHIKKGIYRIPLKRLRDYGGAIGPNKKKIHEWLRENNYELVRTLTRGTRFTKEYSMVKLTDWVKLKIDLSSATPEETFGLRFPKYSKLNDQQITDTYDLLRVDLISLEKYIQSLALNCKSLKSKEYQNLIRAVLIYDCAKHNNGCYPQKKLDPPSIFGRKYYSGISIQNIKKELRAPVLGDCWEYDIRSCVVTWKLGYAQKYLDSKKDGTAAVVDAFLFSYAYVHFKEEIINPIKSSVFINSQLDDVEQTSLIKEALTALNFGARLTVYGFVDKFGKSQVPALAKIFTDKQELQRFNKCGYVSGFLNEQKELDTFILADAKQNQPEIFAYPKLRTKTDRKNSKKILSYLFQHAETDVMNVVRKVASESNLTLLANIHDAVIFKENISDAMKKELEAAMRKHTGNPYWALGKKQLKGW